MKFDATNHWVNLLLGALPIEYAKENLISDWHLILFLESDLHRHVSRLRYETQAFFQFKEEITLNFSGDNQTVYEERKGLANVLYLKTQQVFNESEYLLNRIGEFWGVSPLSIQRTIESEVKKGSPYGLNRDNVELAKKTQATLVDIFFEGIDSERELRETTKQGIERHYKPVTPQNIQDFKDEVIRKFKSVSAFQTEVYSLLIIINQTKVLLSDHLGIYGGVTLTVQEPEPTEPIVKLQWNGAADTLYDVFRQLKNHHLPNGGALVEDSYDQIVRFIQQSFVGFDKVATSTIRGKLTKNDRPKKSFNRIDLNLSKPN